MKTDPASGFSATELLIVLLILSTLAVTAIPKLLSIDDEAYRKAIVKHANALGSAIADARSQWIKNQHSDYVRNLQGFRENNLDVNRHGWVVGASHSNFHSPDPINAKKCEEVWTASLERAPKVALTQEGQKAIEYLVHYENQQCRFIYQREPSYSIFYNPRNGQISVDLEKDAPRL